MGINYIFLFDESDESIVNFTFQLIDHISYIRNVAWNEILLK